MEALTYAKIGDNENPSGGMVKNVLRLEVSVPYPFKVCGLDRSNIYLPEQRKHVHWLHSISHQLA